jgi:hypothetical protein
MPLSKSATASRACVDEAAGVPGLLTEGLPKMVPLKDGPKRYVSNSSFVISFQLSLTGLSCAARYLMKAMKAHRIPRWPGPMAMGSSPVAVMKESFSISDSIRDPKSSTFSIMALASNFAMGPSTGWFITVRTTYLRAASPWALVNGILSDCSRRASTIEVFECRSTYLSDLMSLSRLLI